MSSDRPNNDMGSYNIKTKESNKPLDYMFMINAHENCTTCGDQPNVSVHLDRVNLENDLFGLNRKLSRDPKEKYQFDPTIAKTLNYNPPYLCERYITDPSFINPTDKNTYMEDLKKMSIDDLKNSYSLEKFESGYISQPDLFELLIDHALNNNDESTTNLTNALNSTSFNYTATNMMNNMTNMKLFKQLKTGLPQDTINNMSRLSPDQIKNLQIGLSQDQINVLINFLSSFSKKTNNVNTNKYITLFINILSNL